MFVSGTVVFLLSTTAAAPTNFGVYDNGCPKDSRIEKLLPHKNCGQYYQCFHGALVARNCPRGLNFNAVLEKCDSTLCFTKPGHNNSTIDELDANNPSDASQICSSTDLNGVLIAHENCNEFYKCSHGIAVALKCAQGLLFDTLTDKCDWAQNVDCGERATVIENQMSTTKTKINKRYPDFKEKNKLENPSTTKIRLENPDSSKNELENSYFSLASVLCSSDYTDGVLAAHEHCNSFYKCSRGEPISVKCAKSLLYDPIKKRCENREIVQCDDRTIAEDEISNNNAPNEEKNINSEENENYSPAAICASKNSERDVAAHERCSHFYKCMGKEPVAFKCPGNLLFNSKKNICDWPTNVDCGDKIKSNDTDIENEKRTDDTRSADIRCSSENSDGILIVHDSCNKFYKCINGKLIETKCPGMLLYNPKTENCDWPTHVNCEDRKIPESALALRTGDQNDVENENENEDENRKVKSTYFLKKDIDGGDGDGDGGEEENSISSGRLFGSHHDSDNLHADLGDIDDNSESNDYLTDAAKICDAENSDGILLPHENCNQYYKCFERGAMAQFCQLNHYYNPNKAQCDWIRNVNCDSRVVPNNDVNVDDDADEGENNKVDDECEGRDDGLILPHENCSQFYKCVLGQKYAMECLPGLYYDTLLKVCDWPMKVDCGDRLTEAQVRDQNQLV